MEHFYLKNHAMQFVIILCYFIGSSFSVSLFGIDLPAQDRNVNTRFETLSQSLRPNVNHKEPNIPFSHKDNLFQPNLLNPTPKDFVENVQFKPALPSEFINQLTSDTQKTIPDTPIKLDSAGFFNIKEEPSKATESPNQTSKDVSALNYTLGWSEIATDYTTETLEYETTTDEDLNRIGGPAPAVVASLLG